jgi:hypothetical protein
VVSVDQLDLHLVLAGGHSGYVNCIVVTRIRPQPGQVVDGYVQMPDTWRYLEGARPPEHGYDAHVLPPVLAQKMPWDSPSGSGGSTISLGAGDGSLGFFVGFSVALVLAATPWRRGTRTT